MKKVLWILILTLLLCGCEQEPNLPTELLPTEPEPTIPWVYETGVNWDGMGTLLEVPVTVPDGMHYSSVMEFGGDLLLCSTDAHWMDISILELALFDLDTGTCTVQGEFQLTGYPMPQALGEMLYICDNESGIILQLDKNLNVVNRWEMNPSEGAWYMGADLKLYQFREYSSLWVFDLNDGSGQPLMEGDPMVDSLICDGHTLCFEYFRPNTGAKIHSVLDLQTGEVISPKLHAGFDSVSYSGKHWLSSAYTDGYIYHLQISGDEIVQIETGNSYLQLLGEDYLLLTSDDYTTMSLYDLRGNAISTCHISETGNYYALDPIWCDSMNGFFIRVEGFASDRRLLFWSIGENDPNGEPLNLIPVESPSDEEQSLSQRAAAIGEKYGLTVLIGNECEERFTDFYGSVVTDYQRVSYALDILEEALSVYPQGFLAQLKNDSFRGIQIQLISDLVAEGAGRDGGDYAGFTELKWNYYLMVIDIDVSDKMTYYHEFSHIIDSHLEDDAREREDAIYSESAWSSFNPRSFEGYTYDYGLERELNNYQYFVDSYSTISPTEDRARVMEYAMSDYGMWTFEEAQGLLEKLDYYCRCIRQVFDTTGWPETVIWEQYLYLKSE